MVGRILIVMIYFLAFVSCNPNINNARNNEMVTWELNNDQLKEQILFYIDSVNVPDMKNKFVYIEYEAVNDSTYKYTLDYCFNAYSLIYSPPVLFFEVKGNLVCMSVNGLNDFLIKRKPLIGVIKTRFPDQYEYYNKNGDFPPPITAREVLWELTFQNGKLIRKELITH